MTSDPRVERFAALVAAQPDNELFRFSLAQALSAAGRDEEAIAHYEYCVGSKAGWMMPRILLGKLHLARGHPDSARPLLEDALRLAVEQDHEEPEAELRALLAGR